MSMIDRLFLSIPWGTTVTAGLMICLCSCSSPVHSLGPSETKQYTPFLHDGKTTAQETEGRLGSQYDNYEEGRIRIYQVAFDDRNRLTLKEGQPCYALTLVFDDYGILSRHNLVRNGCGKPP